MSVLSEWEQANLDILTSKEMGEWLSRRESRLLDQISDEIKRKASSGQWSDATVYGMQKAITVINKYRN